MHMKVFIEISKGSKLKYEHDKETGALILDRILHNTNSFPYNYVSFGHRIYGIY